jgi:hypothetical protein
MGEGVGEDVGVDVDVGEGIGGEATGSAGAAGWHAVTVSTTNTKPNPLSFILVLMEFDQQSVCWSNRKVEMAGIEPASERFDHGTLRA